MNCLYKKTTKPPMVTICCRQDNSVVFEKLPGKRAFVCGRIVELKRVVEYLGTVPKSFTEQERMLHICSRSLFSLEIVRYILQSNKYEINTLESWVEYLTVVPVNQVQNLKASMGNTELGIFLKNILVGGAPAYEQKDSASSSACSETSSFL